VTMHVLCTGATCLYIKAFPLPACIVYSSGDRVLPELMLCAFDDGG